MFIFTTYVTLPLLTRVGSADGRESALMLRKIADGGREKEFLMSLLGIGGAHARGPGIADPAVRWRIGELGAVHRGLPGMKGEYLDIFAGVIGLSYLRTAAALKYRPDTDDCARYWRYLSQSMALFGAELGDRETVTDRCERFVTRHSGADRHARACLAQLSAAHPGHMATCHRALFPATRRVVGTLAAEPHRRRFVS
ncbi:hypothetical protein ACIPWE_23315 [Streptomyces sp. NPDC090073]|uniref:hypothetical protein n=1 Tax=Streptomyces sp. NPDC090073 TaxID=3365936 RepID=UPI00380CDEC4